MQELINQSITASPVVGLLFIFFAGGLSSVTGCALWRLPLFLSLISGPQENKKRLFLNILFLCGGLLSGVVSIGMLMAVAKHFAGFSLRFSRHIYMIIGVLLISGGVYLAHIKKLVHCDCAHREVPLVTKSGCFGLFVIGVLFSWMEIPSCPCCGSMLLFLSGLSIIVKSYSYLLCLFLVFGLGQVAPLAIIAVSGSSLMDRLRFIRKYEALIQFIGGNLLIIIGLIILFIA